MTYSLSLDQAPSESVEQVRRSQLGPAYEGLRRDPTDAEAIHDARKRLKKTRALLRLTRPALSSKAFRKRNRALRDTGRRLSAARDATALAETVADLAERHPNRSEFAVAHTILAARDAEPQPAAEALFRLADAPWPLDALTEDMLAASLTHSYRKGRQAFARADRRPTDKHLHEWRKRVKDLWYQQQLLTEAWPALMKVQAKQAKKLSKLLGEDHDLAVLAHVLRSDPELAALASSVHPLIAERRSVLLRRSRKLGRRIYAEKPKHYARRLGRYVELA